MTLLEIDDFCKKNKHSLYCVFPFRNEEGSYNDIRVVNQYYDIKANKEETDKAIERLQKLSRGED